MKYFFIFIMLIITLPTFGQSEKELRKFGEEYFKHFQQKDFEKIMVNFATLDDKLKLYKAEFKKEPSSYEQKRIKQLQALYKKRYPESLLKQYGAGEIMQRSKLENIEAKLHQHHANVGQLTLFFRDTVTNQMYQLYPGNLYYVADKGWVVYAHFISVAFKGSIAKNNHGINAKLPYQEIKQQGEPKAVVEPPEPRQVRDANHLIFTATEQEAEFPGGKNAMISWLARNIEYPRHAREGNVTGTVLIEFVVNTDGSIEQEKIIQEIGGGCGAEVMRMVKKMPKWKPAKHNGVTVRSYFTLPITFETPE